MCDYCSGDEKVRQAAREHDEALASDLIEFANFLRHLTHGDIAPHGASAKTYSRKVYHIIRELTNDWM